ncbi:glycosyltransferase family 2 protein [Photobacterium leiognathi]|uniref:glycosyltransferase family 2 protein n=1 Tax=Photobacterium leiognathi TaxID=553611 RepID=UPI0002088C7F|nr:glycosyltransferase family 2 protein [Photobacterium leiognathi]PSW52852.1 glycosyltransferase family 2 protein [Photobacterium leiognathi subsp. mandapamensis]GAA05741.1 glycosyl transferase 2 family protein [Photobacterium leiognathi subsp. mandapamensis svers.1.1.]
MSAFNPCFLIPCYNHGATVSAVIDALTPYGFPIIVVDDGSELATRKILSEQAKRPNINIVTLPKNQGKGGAVIAGIKQADRLGFSHALQIDADGQHDLAALPKLLEASQAHPEALISGQPIYDDSVPKSRLYGRYATHIWVWIETLSFNIKDSMCGFRSYPIRPIVNVINHNKLGLRMDFDTEIMVRFYWDNGDIRFIDTKVIYPEDGISHFDALWDNVKISWMHTKLFFGMLPRIPKLIKRKSTDQQHWSSHAERGTILGIKTLLAVYSLLGRKAFNVLLKAVMGYYYLTEKKARKASEDYLEQLESYASDNQLALPSKLNSYDHLLSFGHTMLDKLVAWKGDYSENNLTIHGDEHFNELVKRQQGIVVLGSHLGNLELCRALSSRHPDIKINALVFTEHAERFNAVLKAINPDSDLNLIQVNELGADTAIMLQQKVEQGEWVVIVGDRTSVTKEQRVVWADFLGKPAPFPQGPFILASVLKVPVYTLFGLRDDSQATPHFDVYFEPFSEQLILPRKTRETALQETVQQYASRLESYTIKAPLQWYNFFNFWQLSGKNNDNQ